MNLTNRVGTILSTYIIVSIYYIGLFVRFFAVNLLNVVVYARFRHASSEKQLIKSFLPSDLTLERRNNHIGLCLKSIKFDKECPLAYRIIQISPYLSLVAHITELENLWIGFSKTASHKISIAIGGVSIEYYLVTAQDMQQFSFINEKPSFENESLENISELTDEFIRNSVAIDIVDVEPEKELVSKDVQHGIGKLLIDLMKTISINIEKISIWQRNSSKSLNFTTHHLSYEYTADAFVVQLADLQIDFVENAEKNDILSANFTQRLSLKIGENLTMVRLAFEQPDGQVVAHLAGNALSELILWQSAWKRDNFDEPKVSRKSKKIAGDQPFRVEIALSAQVIVTTLEKNTFRWCLSDLQICFDNIIDSNRVITRVGNVIVEIKQNNDDLTKIHVGLIECSLTADEFNCLLCEETILLFNDLPLVRVCENVQLHFDFATLDVLWIILQENTETHLKISGSATLINQLAQHLTTITRDLLDTLMPNRLFIPGLAEARREFHQRTDKPLSAEKLAKKENDLPRQTALLFSLVFAPNVTCRIEAKLDTSQTRTSFSLLTAEITSFEGCFYALPSTLEQFCDRNLTSSWAIDIRDITLHDSVVGSHWRHALKTKTPLEIRFIQKTTYLPVLRCEKKLGFYNNGTKIRVDAHLHEVYLRFIIDYYKEIVGKKSAKRHCDQEDQDSQLWSLKFAPLTIGVSYKPSTSHGSLVNNTFLETGVPNISLSNANVTFKPYQSELLHHSFAAAMSDYFGSCFPEVESILLSASKALPIIQPIVQTATELASDLSNSNRTWKQTAARVTSNVVYSGTKLSVAAFKVARSTDRWLAKKQQSHLKSATRNRLTFEDNSPLMEFEEQLPEDCAIVEDYQPEKKAQEKNSSPQKIAADDENVSIYANQPRTLNRALSDGAAILQENAKIAFSALVTEPKKAFKYGSWQSGAAAALYGLPRAITRSATGLTGATVKLGHGLSNAIDEEKYHQRHNKWKSESYAK